MSKKLGERAAKTFSTGRNFPGPVHFVQGGIESHFGCAKFNSNKCKDSILGVDEAAHDVT
jgi:hypothetical protein